MPKKRCAWCEGDTLYEAYHDNEWGTPVRDDATLFEFLVLEGFQAGLSWITVLRKRENFRAAFDNFDYKKISTYNQEKMNALLQDAGIIRNRLKIRATVANAKAFMAVQKEFGSFSNYLWANIDGKPLQNMLTDHKLAPARTELSDALGKDLKKRGFSFVGSTIMYAFMQATGMVNDHEISCFRYAQLQGDSG